MCKNRTRKFCFSSFFVPTTEPPTALFGRSFADDIDRSVADVSCDIRAPFCPNAPSNFPGVPESFSNFFGSRLSRNCGCLWTKWDTRFDFWIRLKAFGHARLLSAGRARRPPTANKDIFGMDRSRQDALCRVVCRRSVVPCLRVSYRPENALAASVRVARSCLRMSSRT